MPGSLTGMLFGLLVGLRHAFEPDHLTAVSTLVADAQDGRRGALLGMIWGLGHTISLVVVGVVLIAARAQLPEHVAAVFELAVSAMLILLGVRAVMRSVRRPRRPADASPDNPTTPHRHGPFEHAHGDAVAHIHLAGRIVAWRPLVVGLIHGLAGSGGIPMLGMLLA